MTAITMLHESGTGGAPTYGLIPQMPLTTIEGVNLLDNLTYMQPRIGADVASVGHYQTHLQNGVTAEMSASMHAGIMRYQYPEDQGRYVLVDLSHFIPSTGKKEQWYSNGFIERSEDGSWYSGYGVYREGWAWGKSLRPPSAPAGLTHDIRRRLSSLLLRSFRYHTKQSTALLWKGHGPVLAKHDRRKAYIHEPDVYPGWYHWVPVR